MQQHFYIELKNENFPPQIAITDETNRARNKIYFGEVLMDTNGLRKTFTQNKENANAYFKNECLNEF